MKYPLSLIAPLMLFNFAAHAENNHSGFYIGVDASYETMSVKTPTATENFGSGSSVILHAGYELPLNDNYSVLLGGTYDIDYTSDNPKFKTYRTHIFPFEYDERLSFYYNNNQRFLQKRLDPSIIKKSKLFEKEEIRWICVDDIKRMRPKFRSYFQNIIDIILNQQKEIKAFILKNLKKDSSTRFKKIPRTLKRR